jgi:hypothetical protein
MPEMNVEESRQYLSGHFGRPVEDVDTEELQNMYDEAMAESKQSQYTQELEELLQALNLELASRRVT